MHFTTAVEDYRVALKKCDASELESSYEFGFRIKQARIELKLDFWRLKSA